MILEIDTADYEEWLEKYDDGKYKRLPYVVEKSKHYDEYGAYSYINGEYGIWFGSMKHTADECETAVIEMMNEGYTAIRVSREEADRIELIRTADRLGLLK